MKIERDVQLLNKGLRLEVDIFILTLQQHSQLTVCQLVCANLIENLLAKMHH